MKRISIGSRPTSRDELGGWYASILAEQVRSGQSVREFAASAGISAWSLYQWKRRLSHAESRCSRRPARLVEVVVQGERSRTDQLRVRLRSGHRIDVPVGFDDGELRRLIEVLGSC